MDFDFSKIANRKKTKKVQLAPDVELTVTEIPFHLLLQVKGFRKVLASSIARFTQQVPLCKEELVKQNIPSEDDPDSDDLTVNHAISGEANPKLIDKSVEVKAQAIEDLASTILDEEFIYDLLSTTVLEFKGESKEAIIGPEGLTIPMLFKIAVAIVDLNFEDIQSVGNSLSLFTKTVKGVTQE
jgi:hypothetical protein